MLKKLSIIKSLSQKINKKLF